MTYFDEQMFLPCDLSPEECKRLVEELTPICERYERRESSVNEFLALRAQHPGWP